MCCIFSSPRRGRRHKVRFFVVEWLRYLHLQQTKMYAISDLEKSWYPVVYPEFQVKPDRPYNFSLSLIPLANKQDDAAIQSRDDIY